MKSSLVASKISTYPPWFPSLNSKSGERGRKQGLQELLRLHVTEWNIETWSWRIARIRYCINYFYNTKLHPGSCSKFCRAASVHILQREKPRELLQFVWWAQPGTDPKQSGLRTDHSQHTMHTKQSGLRMDYSQHTMHTKQSGLRMDYSQHTMHTKQSGLQTDHSQHTMHTKHTCPFPSPRHKSSCPNRQRSAEVKEHLTFIARMHKRSHPAWLEWPSLELEWSWNDGSGSVLEWSWN